MRLLQEKAENQARQIPFPKEPPEKKPFAFIFKDEYVKCKNVFWKNTWTGTRNVPLAVGTSEKRYFIPGPACAKMSSILSSVKAQNRTQRENNPALLTKSAFYILSAAITTQQLGFS